MPFTKYGVSNNAQGQLLAGIGASATSLILKSGQGAKFPPSIECPFFIKVEKLDTALNGYRVLKREIMIVTNRTGDALTITRSQWLCPPDYATNTLGTTAFSFDADDIVTQTIVAEHIEEIQTAIGNKLDTVAGLRTGFWTGKHVRVNESTGVEEIKDVTTVTIPTAADIVRLEKGDWNYEDILYSDLKNDISTASKYVPYVPVWETIWSWNTTLALIETNTKTFIGSNATHTVDIVARTLTGIRFTPPSDVRIRNVKTFQNSTNALASIALRDNAGTPLVTRLVTSGQNTVDIDYELTGGTTYQLVLNDTTYFNGRDEYLPFTGGNFWLAYLVNWLSNGGATDSTYAHWITSYAFEVSGAIKYSNTLGSNIAWARLKSGITFSVPYNTTLWVVNVWQNATSTSARIQLLDASGTFITEQTPSVWTNTVTFPNTTINANTVYKLVVNDSTYFNGQNNELILATYKTGFRFATWGTVNGTDGLTPQAITQVRLWTRKAMKNIANKYIDFLVFGGVSTTSKVVWDLVWMDSNEWSVISGFSWLVKDTYYYASNTAGTPATAWGDQKYPIWVAISTTEMMITRRSSHLLRTITSQAASRISESFYHFGWPLIVEIGVNGAGAPSSALQLCIDWQDSWFYTYKTITSTAVSGWANSWSVTTTFDIPRWFFRISNGSLAGTTIYH